MVKVTCQIDTYGDEVKPTIKIHNHWNNDAFVEIEVGGEKYVVKGRELKEAVNNCMNTAKF